MTNKEIRRKSREKLVGIFEKPWLMMVVGVMVISALSSAVGALDSGLLGYNYILQTEQGVSIEYRISFGILSILLSGVLSYGAANFFLCFVRGKEKIDFVDIFEAFKSSKKFFSALILGILQSLFVFLWSLLFIIPGIVKSYSYSMAFYIMKDHPEYTAKQCIDESRRMMRGNKMKLFLLDLSFIGWDLVGLLCCCVGVLWSSAYMNTARAEFYCSLVREQGGDAQGDGNTEPSQEDGEKSDAPENDAPENDAPEKDSAESADTLADGGDSEQPTDTDSSRNE